MADTQETKTKRRTTDTYKVISVPNEIGNILNEIKGNFSYSDIIKYLLIKTGHLTVAGNDLKEYLAMENYFEYISKLDKTDQE